MKNNVFKLVLVINILALGFLFFVWWINGKEQTWLFLSSAAIVLTSFLYIKSPKNTDR